VSQPPPAPADVVRTVADGVCRLIIGELTEPQMRTQLDQLARLYAERTDVRHPLAPLGDAPLRTRADVRRHFAEGLARTQGVESFEAVGHVHQTSDPELVVFEFSYVGSVNSRPFTVPCVFVTRVRNGVIVESRDYVDHLSMARAFGRLGDLAGALTADVG
jgi:ketosteroid isomerase-like protein